MNIDKNEFFREATLRICGNLDIEDSLHSTLLYLKEIIPVSRMILEYYDNDLNAMRTIAKATMTGGMAVDLVTPLSEEAKKQAAGKYLENRRKVYLFSKPITEQLALEMLNFHGIDASSLIVLILESGNQVLGTLAIITEGEETLTGEDAGLVSLLSEPFAIALSNTLKHRKELKVFERNFFWEVTMRICGNLEIEEGLSACFEYISQHIPLNSLYLERYESKLHGNRIIARATADGSETLDILIPLSKQKREEADKIMQEINNSTEIPVLVYNESHKSPLAQYLLESLGEPPSSVMGLPLVLEGQIVGAVTAIAEGKNHYDEGHAALFSTLRVPFFIAMSNALKHKEILTFKNLLADDNQYLQQELKNKTGENIIGSNFGLKGVMEMVRQVADLDSPVMLLGETGTGKDLIATAIHYSSSRHDGPFISVNCGAIPESLIDSELFGHEKGAFTGALSQKRGRFERAHMGTIFLDEVGELPPAAQVRLLRVLQNREIERVGGTKTIPLDIRIITATNRNMERMVQQNRFREDLWFRLNVFPITLPPLRDRKSDIPALLQHFITKKVQDLKLQVIPEIEPGSIELLMGYSWPGNVRELENVVERALILNRKGPVSFKHLNQAERQDAGDAEEFRQSSQILDDVIIRHINAVLSKTKGKIHGTGGAAEILGVNPSTLRNKMKKLGIPYKHDHQ